MLAVAQEMDGRSMVVRMDEKTAGGMPGMGMGMPPGMDGGMGMMGGMGMGGMGMGGPMSMGMGGGGRGMGGRGMGGRGMGGRGRGVQEARPDQDMPLELKRQCQVGVGMGV